MAKVIEEIHKKHNKKLKSAKKDGRTRKGKGMKTHAAIMEECGDVLDRYASPFPTIEGCVIITPSDLSYNLAESLKGRTPKYKEEYCLALIHHMANGLTYGTFGGEINVIQDTLYAWEKAYPEFKQAKKIAFARKRGTWEKILSLSAGGLNKGNAASIIFGLKNYYAEDFKDKREVEEKSTTTIIIDTGIERGPTQKVIETTSRNLEDIESVEYVDPLDGL